MIDEQLDEADSINLRLVRYFHDCLAAQTDWGRAINVVDQKDVYLVPLAAREQRKFGADGALTLRDPDALSLRQRVQMGGSHTTLFLAALFLVGRVPASGDRAEKKICAPLLEIPLSIKGHSHDEVTILPEEREFSINYGLLSELLRGDGDDLQDRLADLAELVPDFPIDAGEFDTFWNGFQMIAPEVTVSSNMPSRRKSAKGSTRIADLGLRDDDQEADVQSEADRLRLVDFYVPSIPNDDPFRLLPATAVVFGQKAGRAMSALAELRSMEEVSLSTTAFGSVFDPATARAGHGASSERFVSDDVQPLPLTPTQQAIVESSRSSPLTVVTGPPGTGKSYTITAIVLDAILNGQTVLVASQMDKAVEVVANAVERIAGPLAIARSGGRVAQRDLAKKIARLTSARSVLTKASPSDVDACSARESDLARQVEQLEKSLVDVISAEWRWSQLRYECQDAEPHFTIPVEEASDASVRKAEKLHARAVRHLRSDTGLLKRMWARWDVARVRRLLGVPRDAVVSEDELATLLHLQLLKLQMKEIDRALNANFPSQSIWQELVETENSLQHAAIELLQLVRKQQVRDLVADQQHRGLLRDLTTLLRRRKRQLKQQLKQKLTSDLLLQAFPAWACTTRSLCEILPAIPGMFDLVVIDEASQCDLALASVALMRGKRAVVVGDPQQLRHVSFLSRAREQASFVRNDFTDHLRDRFHYRRSIFDVAADAVEQRRFFLLNEHFRSHPQIIQFSNQKFYEGSLQIMTSRPATVGQHAIELCHVAGKREPGSSVNRPEIDATVQIVEECILSSSATDPVSVGVVSPFREHADALKDRFLSEFSAELIAKHSIVIGTAHSLQGDEKDVIIFTTSIDADSHPASLRFLESPNLFNVAVTRARQELRVVTSVSPDELPQGLLREFLGHAGSSWSTRQVAEPVGSAIETALADQLQKQHVRIWAGFRSAGTRIDLVAMKSDASIALLFDRHSLSEQDAWEELHRHRRLARAGWNVLRIPHRTVLHELDRCTERVIQSLS